ncbi:MAG TPA: WD40 repeat domain-containing protein [Polyangiaceae bacterium]
MRKRFLVAAAVILTGTLFFAFRAPMRRMARPPASAPHTVSGLRPAVDVAAHYSAVFGVAPTPDDGAVWSTSWDDSLHLWNLTSGTPIRTLSPSFGKGSGLAVDEKTGRVAAGGTAAIKVWTKDYALERTIPVTSQQTGLVFSRDGARLFAGSFDGTVHAYDVATGALLQTMTGHRSRVLSIDISPDGGTLVSAGDDGTIRVWRTKDGTLVKSINAHNEPISCVRIGPDGQAIATASDDGTAGLFLRDFGNRILTFRPGDDEVWSVAFDPNGRTIAVGGKSGPIYLVSAMSGTPLRTLSGHERGTLALAFSHDGQTLVSGGGDQHVRIWRGFE